MNHLITKKNTDLVSAKMEEMWVKLALYLRENSSLIFTLFILLIFAYGFELFNFNLTIDEEIHSAYSGPTLEWISQGRWGLYLLNVLVMPRTIIPFIPLSVTLIFQVGAILLLLDCWGARSGFERMIAGVLYAMFPILVYVYTFSTFNYGVGIGFFLAVLSLFLFIKRGLGLALALLPMAFALSIYQGFIPVLVVIFLVYLLMRLVRSEEIPLKDIGAYALIFAGAWLIYYVVQRLLLYVFHIEADSYISSQFDLSYLFENFFRVGIQVLRHLVLPVYFGGKSLYALDIWIMGVLLLVSLASLGIHILKLPWIKRLLAGFLLVFLLFLPFMSGLLMKGQMSMRFLLAAPISYAAIVLLGTLHRPKIYKMFIALLTMGCVYYFVISTNQLSASSHLSLQVDRALATRMMDKIDAVRDESGADTIHYIEIVGYYERQPLAAAPKIETFGASFFGWAWGDSHRIASFLQIMGYPKLDSLPNTQRLQLTQIAQPMPDWPADGSVKIVNDIVIVKFGEYSERQRQEICASVDDASFSSMDSFCK